VLTGSRAIFGSAIFENASGSNPSDETLKYSARCRRADYIAIFLALDKPAVVLQASLEFLDGHCCDERAAQGNRAKNFLVT
jgi:hypothetical protein